MDKQKLQQSKRNNFGETNSKDSSNNESRDQETALITSMAPIYAMFIRVDCREEQAYPLMLDIIVNSKKAVQQLNMFIS